MGLAGGGGGEEVRGVAMEGQPLKQLIGSDALTVTMTMRGLNY